MNVKLCIKKKVPLCLDSEKRKENSRNKIVKILEVKKKKKENVYNHI